jgi:branched-chain amino acid transport system permease protein
MKAPLARRIFQRGRVLGAPTSGVIIVALLYSVAPGHLSLGSLNQLGTLFILLGIAQAWNLISGYGGQILLGVGAFVGTGGYVTTLTLAHSSLTEVPALILAGLGGALLAAIVAYPLFRLQGPYFAVGSLALTLAIQAWMGNWDYSGGTQPISPPFTSVPGPQTLYRMTVVVAALAMLTVWLVRQSNFGLRLMAIRDAESAAEGAGVLTFRTKLGAFVLTGLIMGLAGGVSALQTTAIDPGTSFGLSWTIDAIVMTVVGGMGTLLGPLVGTIVVYYGIETQLETTGAWSQFITGALLLFVVRFTPLGLWPHAQELVRRVFSIGRPSMPPPQDGPGTPSMPANTHSRPRLSSSRP